MNVSRDPHGKEAKTIERESGQVVVSDLHTPGTIDVGLLRRQRDWLLSLGSATSPAEIARLVTVNCGNLDGLLNLLDAMLDSAEGYPTRVPDISRPAALWAAPLALTNPLAPRHAATSDRAERALPLPIFARAACAGVGATARTRRARTLEGRSAMSATATPDPPVCESAPCERAPCLGQYVEDETQQVREIISLARPNGSVFVVDRLARSASDARVVAHLSSGEPPENASLIAEMYLADGGRRGRCRLLSADDLASTRPRVLARKQREHSARPHAVA